MEWLPFEFLQSSYTNFAWRLQKQGICSSLYVKFGEWSGNAHLHLSLSEKKKKKKKKKSINSQIKCLILS